MKARVECARELGRNCWELWIRAQAEALTDQNGSMQTPSQQSENEESRILAFFW